MEEQSSTRALRMINPARRWPRPSVADGLAALIIIGFVVAAAIVIDRPGLEYDETLFVNVATGGHAEMFAEGRVFGVPVMLTAYIGALWAYVYYPIFLIFGRPCARWRAALWWRADASTSRR